MADRVGIVQARATFGVWVKAVGGMTVKEAREQGLPIAGTYFLEEQRIGDGRLRLRVARMMNEGGGQSDPLGYQMRNSRELVDVLNVAIRTLEVVGKA